MEKDWQEPTNASKPQIEQVEESRVKLRTDKELPKRRKLITDAVEESLEKLRSDIELLIQVPSIIDKVEPSFTLAMIDVALPKRE